MPLNAGTVAIVLPPSFRLRHGTLGQFLGGLAINRRVFAYLPIGLVIEYTARISKTTLSSLISYIFGGHLSASLS
jgi:hypothetical protein